jgi:hypothetical protein
MEFDSVKVFKYVYIDFTCLSHFLAIFFYNKYNLNKL